MDLQGKTAGLRDAGSEGDIALKIGKLATDYRRGEEHVGDEVGRRKSGQRSERQSQIAAQEGHSQLLSKEES